MLTNPLLQVFPGRAMTCVFDPDKALLPDSNKRKGGQDRHPDQTDCRPNCRSKAYTDRDIAAASESRRTANRTENIAFVISG